MFSVRPIFIGNNFIKAVKCVFDLIVYIRQEMGIHNTCVQSYFIYLARTIYLNNYPNIYIIISQRISFTVVCQYCF